MSDCETSVIVNTPYLDILAGPGDHLGEELGVVRVEGVVGGLAAGQGRGLRGLLQDAHAVAEVVRLLQHNIRNKYILHFVTSSHRIDCILQLRQPVCHD